MKRLKRLQLVVITSYSEHVFADADEMKGLGTLLPSPLLHQIAKVGARSNNPYFHQVQKDNATDLQYIVYTSIPKITVQVPVTDFDFGSLLAIV
jgi:hypothetical protein